MVPGPSSDLYSLNPSPSPQLPNLRCPEDTFLGEGGIPHPPILLLAGGPDQRPSPDSQAAE